MFTANAGFGFLSREDPQAGIHNAEGAGHFFGGHQRELSSPSGIASYQEKGRPTLAGEAATTHRLNNAHQIRLSKLRIAKQLQRPLYKQ